MQVGYVGLGAMGGALARRLQLSRNLVVFDLNPAAVADLVATPLFGVTLTLAVYLVACRVAVAARGNPLVNPVLVSIVVIVALLLLTGTSYGDYQQGGRLIGFLLGPATVALAVPLHRQRARIRACALPTLVGIGAGAIAGVLVALTVTVALGGDHELARTMAPKSVTAPVAIALSQANGGVAELTAVLTILTGVLGAVARRHCSTWCGCVMRGCVGWRSARRRMASARRGRWTTVKRPAPSRRWRWP